MDEHRVMYQTDSSDQRDLVLEQSIEADVPLAFAWRFRTDIKTWNDQYREQVQTGFGANLAAGMKTLAASMEAAEPTS